MAPNTILSAPEGIETKNEEVIDTSDPEKDAKIIAATVSQRLS